MHDGVSAVGATGASIALTQGVASLTDTLLLSTESFIGINTSPLPLSPGLETLLKGAGQVGLLAGATAGLGIAAGAIWGKAPIRLDGAKWWKRLAFKPATELFNSGIRFRQQAGQARRQTVASQRFLQGAQAGFQVGRGIGSGAGQVQGALTGGLIGWRFSGEVSSLVETFTTGLEIPTLAKPYIPWLIGAACVAAGQMVGSSVGDFLGGLSGGALTATVTGAYCAVSPLKCEEQPAQTQSVD